MSESRIWLHGNMTNTDIPIVMDYEGQVAEYLSNRFRQDELPFAKHVPDDYLQSIIDAETVVADPPKAADLPPVGINEYLMPTGASRFGRGLFLIDNAHITALIQNAWAVAYDGSGNWPATQRSTRSVELNVQDINGDTWFANCYVLPPIQVDSAVTNRQLWIVPVVDKRYTWLHSTLDPDAINVDSATTWQNVIDAINAQHGSFIESLPSAPNTAYLQPDPGYFSVRRSIAYAIDHIAASIGMRAAIAPMQPGYFRDSLRLQTPASAAAELTAWPEPVVFGSESNPRPNTSYDTHLSHRRLNDHYDNETWDAKEETIFAADVNETKPHIVSTFYLESYDETVDSASEAARDALATQIAANYNDWYCARSYNFTIAGVPDANRQLESNGFTDYMLIKVDCSKSMPEVMTTYQSLKPNQQPLVNLSQQPDLYRHPQELARIVLNSTGIPIGQTEGIGEIVALDTSYNGTPNPVTVRLNDPAAVAIGGGSMVTCYYQSEDGWHIVQGEPGPPGPAGSAAPWMRFRAKNPVGYQRSGIWNVIVTQIRNGDGTAVNVGDEIEVHDPNNLFADVVFAAYQNVSNCFGADYIGGSTGTAYLRTPATSNDNPTEVTRWEVETCSRSVDQMDVYLEDCMQAQNLAGGLWTGWGHFNQIDPWMRSAYPAVDFPPEAVDDGDETEGYCWKIPIENPYRLTALGGSLVRIRRETHKAAPSLPTNVTTPHNGGVNANSEKWIVESVYEDRNQNQGQFARFVHVQKAAAGGWGEFNLIDYWHGQDPTAQPGDCQPAIDCSLLGGCECLDDGDDAFAVFDEASHAYHVVSTASGMLGEADDVPIMNSFAGDAGCTFSFAEQTIKAFACGNEPTVGSASLQTVTQRVVGDAFRFGNDICFNMYDIQVCSTAYIEPECVNLCAECDCDEHICAYQYIDNGVDTPGWQLVKSCPTDFTDCCCTGEMPTNTPEPGDPTYVTFPCGPCEPDCVLCDTCPDDCTTGYEFSVADISGTLTNGDRVELVQGSVVWTDSENDCCKNLSVQMQNSAGLTATVTAEVCLIHPSNIPQCAMNNRAALTLNWNNPVVLGMELPTEIGADAPNTCAATYGNNQGCGIVPDFPDQGGGSSWDNVTFNVSCCVVESARKDAALESMGVHDVGAGFHHASLNAPPVQKEPELAPKEMGWGDQFVDARPELFKGCGCKKDIVPVMNRWEHREGEPTDDQIKLVATTLYGKQKRNIQKQITVESLSEDIRQFTQTRNQ